MAKSPEEKSEQARRAVEARWAKAREAKAEEGAAPRWEYESAWTARVDDWAFNADLRGAEGWELVSVCFSEQTLHGGRSPGWMSFFKRRLP